MGTSEKTCSGGVESALGVIGGKWKPVLLYHLSQHGPMRFSELRRATPRITHKMLSQQLRDLESDGIVSRKAYDEVPPRTEYNLTDYGWTLKPVMESLCRWGTTHRQRMADAESQQEQPEPVSCSA